MTDRRSFLLGSLAALAAPAIVRADSLMKVMPSRFEYRIYGDGIHDDTAAFAALLGGKAVAGAPYLSGGTLFIPAGTYLVSRFSPSMETTRIVGAGPTTKLSHPVRGKPIVFETQAKEMFRQIYLGLSP